MRDMRCQKLNNKGLTLVELIVAISIGVIVSGAIAALILFAIRTYRNESVNTSLQYELQTNINMMMDEIMGSSAFLVEQNSGVGLTDTDKGAYTHYALFGNPNVVEKVNDTTDKRSFKGVLFVSSSADSKNRFNIYMNRVETELTGDAKADLESIASGALADVETAIAAETAESPVPNPYLLGENVTQFVILPDPNNRFNTDDHSYTNPIEIKVVLQFEGTGWGEKEYSKRVDDITYMRNKASEKVFIKNPDETVFTGYELRKVED